jgi:regulator of sirC expression with transglutaminase-like and TPR domain
MKDLNSKEVSALINLLDDPDDKIFVPVKEKLLILGHAAIPALEDAWESTFDPFLQTRIEDLIHRIQFDKVKTKLADWMKNRSANLWEGTMLIARYQYPELQEDKLLKQLNIIQQDVWLELNSQLTALEKVKVINHVLFDVHRFIGNTENYASPDNSYLNRVIENKKGNPLSLAILYLTITNRLHLPIFGINLPQHFVMAYVDENDVWGKTWEDRILFYINPFNKGAVFSRREIDMFLNQLSIKPDKSYYTPCSNVEIIKRLIRNLTTAYTKLDNREKIKDMEELMNILMLNA